MSRSSALVAVFACVLLTSAQAQDHAPGPAPELHELAPLLGNWTGSGRMTEPGAKVTQWNARGTYRWCFGGHFVQEDFVITFAGFDAPLVFRAYLGWDRERKRYVGAWISNGGQVQLHELHLVGGGWLQFMVQHQNGVPYAERSRFVLDGDTLSHTIELLLPEGRSVSIVDGTFQRTGDAFDGDFAAATWMGAKPHASLTRLARAAGTYDVRGRMVAAPGRPGVELRARDTFATVFGGTVVRVGRAGVAEDRNGGQLVAETFWTHDAGRDCLVGVSVGVGDLGSVLVAEGRWSQDGRLVGSISTAVGGEPVLQRTMLELDANGAPKRGVTHVIVGTRDPVESSTSAYTKQ